jgi:copper ion binding protein
MDTAILHVQGMTCNHCVQTVKGALEKMKGIKNVEVNLEKGLVNISYDSSSAGVEQLKSAVVEAGYEVS